jgi:hypothetical protein
MHICPGPSAEVAAPALDERAYCDGCRALNWNTTCHGCADRMDNLIAERAAGHKEGYEEGQKDAIDKMAAGLRHRRDKDRNKVIRAALTILIDEIESGRSPS